MPIGQGWPPPRVTRSVTLLIEFEDSHFISWLLHNQCEEHTTCETVNKSSDGNHAYQHSDETVKVLVLSRSRNTNMRAGKRNSNQRQTSGIRVYRLFFYLRLRGRKPTEGTRMNLNEQKHAPIYEALNRLADLKQKWQRHSF